MPERWISFFGHTFPHPKTFLAGLGFSMGSILSVINQENAVAIAMAFVAIGSVLAAPAGKAFTWVRSLKRSEDALDRQQLTGEFEVEVRRRVELEEQVKVLTAQNAAQAEELFKLRKGLNRVGAAVVDSQAKVEEQGHRIETLERVTGSGSGDNIPTSA
jgi:hypothetical protein